MHEHRVPAGDDETANCSAAATTLRASFAVALMCLALAAGPALAATFAVDSTTDAVDDNPGTGTFGTMIIDGRNATQIFNVQGGTVRLDNLVLRRAFPQFNDPGIFGACVGPALFVAGTGVVVDVTGIVIQNNAAINGSWGGICVYSGTLNLDRSSVRNNTATFGGGIRVLFAPGTLNVIWYPKNGRHEAWQLDLVEVRHEANESELHAGVSGGGNATGDRWPAQRSYGGAVVGDAGED